MNDPSSKIGSVLKRVRFERNLTLEDTSNLTSVSKAMLGQIERGESNPTISTLWKISTGLRISFSELLGSGTENYKALKIDEIDPVYESDGKMELYNVFPFDPITGFEYFYIKLIPGASHVSPPHQDSSEEYIVVTEGTVQMTIGDDTFDLEAPTALKFKANENHVYSNPYDKVAIFQNIVRY